MNDINPPTSFYKITGNSSIESIKKQLLRSQCTHADLNEALSVVLLLKTILQNQTENSQIIPSLTVHAIVSYSRCFNSSYSFPLDPNIFDDKIEGDPGRDGAISERRFHYLIMNYRNKHIAHSDDFLKAGDVGGAFINSEFGIAPLLARRVPHEDLNFYNCLERLCRKALLKLEDRIHKTSNKLIECLKSGDAQLTTEELQVVPIPLNINAKEMWGLNES